MARISSIKKKGAEAATPAGVSFNAAIDALWVKEYDTFEQLWEKIGTDFPKGVKKLSEETGVSEDILLDMLAEGARDLKSDLGGLRRARLFWREAVAALLGLALLTLLVWRAVERKEIVFVGAAALPPFHAVTENDVAVGHTLYVPGSYTSVDQVKGRYLIERAPANSRLLAHQLSKIQIADAAKRRVISLPVKAGGISAAISPGDRVSLLFVPRRDRDGGAKDGAEGKKERQTEDESLQVDDAVVLEVNRQGDSSSLVVAINADVKKAAAFLVDSDVVVFRPMTKTD